MIVNHWIIKILMVLLGTTLCLQTALAQQGQMNQQQMQQMMQNAQKMQKCFSNIDQSAVKALADRGKKVEAQVKALCKAGKRDQARGVALAYGKEVNASKDIQAMKKCATMNPAMMQNLPWIIAENAKNPDGGDICGGM